GLSWLLPSVACEVTGFAEIPKEFSWQAFARRPSPMWPPSNRAARGARRRKKISPAGSQNGASLEERIRARAYELYQERGYLDGSADQDWQRAEEELRGRAAMRSA